MTLQHGSDFLIDLTDTELESDLNLWSCCGPVDVTIESQACDCDGNTLDCFGECGGSAEEDNCGTCDSDTSNDCVQDCGSTWGGSALIDECGLCNAFYPDSEPPEYPYGTCDCAGVPNGNFIEDICGVCEGVTVYPYECEVTDSSGLALGLEIFPSGIFSLFNWENGEVNMAELTIHNSGDTLINYYLYYYGYLNGEKSWTNAGAIDEPEMNVTLYQLTSTDLSANYFKTTLTAPPGPTDNYRNLANEKSVYFDCGFTIWLKPDGTWYHKIHGVSGFSSNKGPYKIVNSREISLGGNDYIKWDDNGVRCLKWGKIRNNNCCQ